MKLCCLETVWQSISDFEIHEREINKFEFVNNSLSQIIGDGNKPLFCQHVNLKHDPFKVSLEKFSGWEYCDFYATYCSLTLRLVWVLVPRATARSECIVDFKLTIDARGLLYFFNFSLVDVKYEM